jgi:hypothetical protein
MRYNESIRLDHGDNCLDFVLEELFRWPNPLRDDDVAARQTGQNASGLNAAIIVLRQVYIVLLSLQKKDKIEEEENGDALETLRKNEACFSLLAAAWHNTRHDSDPSAEIIDAFFKTWKGRKGTMSFAHILDGAYAGEHIWSHESFHFFMSAFYMKRPEDLWAAPTQNLSSLELAKASLLKWDPAKHPDLADQLASHFGERELGGKMRLPLPRPPSVLRIRYMPGADAGDKFNPMQDVDFPDIRFERTTQQENGKNLFRVGNFGPSHLAYKLFAAVRLRSKADEDDHIFVVDRNTPERSGEGLVFGLPGGDFWAPGHEYDLFYGLNLAQRKEPDPEHARVVTQMREQLGREILAPEPLSAPDLLPYPRIPRREDSEEEPEEEGFEEVELGNGQFEKREPEEALGRTREDRASAFNKTRGKSSM